jgi:hypothetical protein
MRAGAACGHHRWGTVLPDGIGAMPFPMCPPPLRFFFSLPALPTTHSSHARRLRRVARFPLSGWRAARRLLPAVAFRRTPVAACRCVAWPRAAHRWMACDRSGHCLHPSNCAPFRPDLALKNSVCRRYAVITRRATNRSTQKHGLASAPWVRQDGGEAKAGRNRSSFRNAGRYPSSGIVLTVGWRSAWTGG